ncbi:hypothetical protein SCH01S_28_00420 [Sphingomonas changbaiensis NBRC 104936]|uniref:Uncharacterized protein n=1 Tax=Sphingomonas changbaiensis NBRC 104936 TaxID=1219043 RepID=A0A0E9MNU8_9SPHN|nr:hypothetical protein [Sphingomonas changbaiensis]GAO39183.1 hypothetical protein SCH01S_28_00420 [Sphingomonas changbaiensis NBRC 104936]
MKRFCALRRGTCAAAILVTSTSAFAQAANPLDTAALRFLNVQIHHSAGRSCGQASDFADRYVRLKLVPADDTFDPQGRQMGSRWLVWRALIAKKASRVALARVSISKPELSSTATLANVSWNSGRKGEDARSDLEVEHFLTPFFRVDPQTVIKVTFDVTGSSGIEASFAGDALSIVNQAVKTSVAPSDLVTPENLPQLQRGAAAIDRAVSQFFNQRVGESVTRTLSLGDGEVTAAVSLPYDWSVFKKKDFRIGSWRLVVDGPRPSIFSAVSLERPSRCGISTYELNSIYKSIAPEQINNFKVRDTETLEEHLSGMERVDSILTQIQVTVAAYPNPFIPLTQVV